LIEWIFKFDSRSSVLLSFKSYNSTKVYLHKIKCQFHKRLLREKSFDSHKNFYKEVLIITNSHMRGIYILHVMHLVHFTPNIILIDLLLVLSLITHNYRVSSKKLGCLTWDCNQSWVSCFWVSPYILLIRQFWLYHTNIETIYTHLVEHDISHIMSVVDKWFI